MATSRSAQTATSSASSCSMVFCIAIAWLGPGCDRQPLIIPCWIEHQCTKLADNRFQPQHTFLIGLDFGESENFADLITLKRRRDAIIFDPLIEYFRKASMQPFEL